MSTTEPLRQEHAELLPRLEAVRAAADAVGEVPTPELMRLLDEALAFLRRDLIPHAGAEDAALYPVVAGLLGAPAATETMILDHVEVGRLTEALAGLRAQLEEAGLRPGLAKELRRVLYGLHALVSLHFHKEEAAYLPLLDARLGDAEADRMFKAMEAAAGRLKAGV